jgi:plastocyanin
LLAGGLMVAALMLATGLAFAASATIVGTGSNVFSPTAYTADQGEVSQLQVTGSMHNVTSTQTGPDGNPLFKSATISSGTTPVNGTQFLGPGDYPFFCTVHGPSMSGTLHVNAAGTPQARPHVDLRITTKKLSKAIGKGLSLEINSNAKVSGVEVVAKLGKATIGTASNLAFFEGQQFDVIRLTKSGKAKLRGKSKASVSVTATIPFGDPASVVTTGKLS